VMRVRIGDRVEPGRPLAEVHARSEAAAAEAVAALAAAVRVVPEPVPAEAAEFETVG
jgi:thymidine phosphorylase